MKTGKMWWIVGGIAVLVAGAIWFAISNKDGMPSYSQPGSTTVNTESGGTSTVAGTYVPYSEEAFAAAEGRRWLFFHAGWCPQCRAIENDIKEQGAPDGVTILKVNYDSESALKKKYGVTLQTTFIEVDADGNEIQKFVAYDTPSLQAVMNVLGG